MRAANSQALSPFSVTALAFAAIRSGSLSLPGSEEIHLQVKDATKKQGNALLLHGLTGTPSEVASLAQYLNDRNFEVYVPLLLGHGNSITELSRVTSKAWIADAERALLKFEDERQFPPAVIGLSFGALLASYLAGSQPQLIKKLVLISIPMKLSSRFKESGLAFFSLLPDFLLNLLPTVAKTKRREGCHLLPHNAFRFHSVGAVSRLVQVRNLVLSKIREIEADILILQDPNDHHVSAEVPELLQKLVPNRNVTIEWLPGGEHELTLGASYEKVSELVYDFLVSRESCRES